MSYRVFPRYGSVLERGSAIFSDIVTAIDAAVADGSHVINLSLGHSEDLPGVDSAILRAREAGVPVVVASGNDGSSPERAPARYPYATGVGGLGRDNTFPSTSSEASRAGSVREKDEFVGRFSNHGGNTLFIAPGVGVLSTWPGGSDDRYAACSGTSMAAPFVTGMLARLLSQEQKLPAMTKFAVQHDAIVDRLAQRAQARSWGAQYGKHGVPQ